MGIYLVSGQVWMGQLAVLYLEGLHPSQAVYCCACLLGCVELHILFEVLNILWQMKVEMSTASLISKELDQHSGYLESSRIQIGEGSTKIYEPLKS